jgi:hypothetical protein
MYKIMSTVLENWVAHRFCYDDDLKKTPISANLSVEQRARVKIKKPPCLKSGRVV